MTATHTPLGAARTVTGSRHLIEIGGRRLLVDCGLYQERELTSRNWERFPVEPSELDAVLLTHGHLDHCGYLPKLVREGFTGPIWATSATCDIVPILLADSAHLQEEDAAFKNKRHAKEGRRSRHGEKVKPLYTADDVDPVLRLLRPVEYQHVQTVAPGITCTWRQAGHILGAAGLLIEGGGRRIFLSGDLGRPDRPLLPDPEPPPACDLLIVESTYGDRLHPQDDDVPGHLAEVVGGTAKLGGKVLIPCFALERAQDLLWHLANLHEAGRIPDLPVFLDSPMAIHLLEVFQKHPEAADTALRSRLKQGGNPFTFHGLKLCPRKEDSQAINDRAGPAIIIAGAGMLNGGRIKHHLAQHIHEPESVVLFVGYQAAGTLGRQLVEGAKRVRLLGREMEVAIRTASISGFSGHADRDETLAWLAAAEARPGRIAVVHGGPNVAPAFAALVAERIGVPTAAPQYLERTTV